MTCGWTCGPRTCPRPCFCAVSSRPVAPGCRSTSTRCRRASPTRTARVRAPTPAPPTPPRSLCNRGHGRHRQAAGRATRGADLLLDQPGPVLRRLRARGRRRHHDRGAWRLPVRPRPPTPPHAPHPTSHLTGHASGGTRKGSTSSRGSTLWSRSSASLPPAADPCPSSTTNTCTCHLSPNCRSMPACKSWLSLAVRDGRRGVPQLVQLARRAVDGREGEGARRTLHGRILSRQLL